MCIRDRFVAAGGLYRMDRLSDFIPFMEERLPQDIMEQHRSPDGHFYQVPWKGNPIMLALSLIHI